MGPQFALGLIALVAPACGITARSDDFRCSAAAECGEGRACVDGWCVTGQGDAGSMDGALPLADGGAGDAAACPAACDSCQRQTCIISCDDTGACPELVVCPAGMECEVRCAGTTACESGIDCSAATRCDITCNDTGSCSGPITCGPGRCDVECNGAGSCSGGIDCSDSCRCNTDCDGVGSCIIEPSCPSAECIQGIECIDVGPGCHSCQ
jgi:hypothetical protein